MQQDSDPKHNLQQDGWKTKESRLKHSWLNIWVQRIKNYSVNLLSPFSVRKSQHDIYRFTLFGIKLKLKTKKKHNLMNAKQNLNRSHHHSPARAWLVSLAPLAQVRLDSHECIICVKNCIITTSQTLIFMSSALFSLDFTTWIIIKEYATLACTIKSEAETNSQYPYSRNGSTAFPSHTSS